MSERMKSRVHLEGGEYVDVREFAWSDPHKHSDLLEALGRASERNVRYVRLTAESGPCVVDVARIVWVSTLDAIQSIEAKFRKSCMGALQAQLRQTVTHVLSDRVTRYVWIEQGATDNAWTATVRSEVAYIGLPGPLLPPHVYVVDYDTAGRVLARMQTEAADG